jgi:ribosomal protein S27AE
MEKLVIADIEEFKPKHPPCPNCKSMNIASKGIEWRCRDCGRSYKKIKRSNTFPIIDKESWFYKNCKIQRSKKAKICQECPFRQGIELQELNASM